MLPDNRNKNNHGDLYYDYNDPKMISLGIYSRMM